MMLTVEKAAIIYKGVTYSVSRPGRHHDVIAVIHEATGDMNIYGNQGFMLSDGTFAQRIPALRVAEAAGQLTERGRARLACGAQMLFSEDVW